MLGVILSDATKNVFLLAVILSDALQKGCIGVLVQIFLVEDQFCLKKIEETFSAMHINDMPCGGPIHLENN